MNYMRLTIGCIKRDLSTSFFILFKIYSVDFFTIIFVDPRLRARAGKKVIILFSTKLLRAGRLEVNFSREIC